MKKLLLVGLVGSTCFFATASAIAGEVKFTCPAGIFRYVEPNFARDGELLSTVDLKTTSAQCVAGDDMYILKVPGFPQFSSLEAARKMLEWIADNGKELQDGKSKPTS